jgi:hypothetical protein
MTVWGSKPWNMILEHNLSPVFHSQSGLFIQRHLSNGTKERLFDHVVNASALRDQLVSMGGKDHDFMQTSD